MILNAYSLLDVKAASFSPPFFAPAHGLATRMVMELVQDAGTTVGRHPADFTLYCLGRFDTVSGEMLPSQREHIADCLTLAPRPAAPLFDRPAEANFDEPSRFPVKKEA